METKDSILKGTALLTGAGIIVKLLGAAYRIPLSRLIGSEGIGLYQMAYPIYLIFLSLSTAGLPIAISKIIAEQSAKGNREGIGRTFTAALILLIMMGLMGSLIMFWAAPWFAGSVVADSRAVYAMRALAPAIFLMSLMAAYRGFFQGQQIMSPSAVSQIIEQFVRVAVALILVCLLLKSGIEYAAAGAAFGASAGGGAGLVFLMLRQWQVRRRNWLVHGREKSRESLLMIMKRLIHFALPISVAVILMPLLQTIDSLIVPAKLQSIGYTVSQATSMLGILGNAWAVMYLPMVVTSAIAANLVPAVAASNIQGAGQEQVIKIETGLRLAFLYLVPVVIFLYLFGKTVYRIIYNTPGIEILSWLAPAVFFLGLEQVSAGILQGLGKPKIPLVNFVAGAILKIIVTLTTTALPGLNLAGAALGTVCGSGLTAILNLMIVRKLTHIKLVGLPAAFFSGIFLLSCSFLVQRWLQLHYILEFLEIGFGGTLLYVVILRITGGINSQDLEMLKKYLVKRSTRHGYGDITQSG
jgi:stage V sporulation protein B